MLLATRVDAPSVSHVKHSWTRGEDRPGPSRLCGEDRGGNLLCNGLERIPRRLEASKIRQDPAVLGDLGEGDAVQDGD